MQTATKVAIGVTAGVVLAVGAAAAAEHFAHSSSSGGGPVTTSSLTPGHRYGLTLTCPSGMKLPLPPPPIPDAAVVGLLGIPSVSIVSFTVAAGGNGFAVVFDYAGTATIPLPAIQSSGATPCQTQLVDQGPTPVGQKHPVPVQGGGGGKFHVPQQVNLQTGVMAKVAALAGGALLVTAPGTITGVNGAPMSSWTAGSTSDQATIILNGQTGAIAVEWSTGHPQPQGATIQVS